MPRSAAWAIGLATWADERRCYGHQEQRGAPRAAGAGAVIVASLPPSSHVTARRPRYPRYPAHALTAVTPIVSWSSLTPIRRRCIFEQHGWGDGLPLVPPTRSGSRHARVLRRRRRADGRAAALLGRGPSASWRRSGGCCRRVSRGVSQDPRSHPDVNLRGWATTSRAVATIVSEQCGFTSVRAPRAGEPGNATVGRAVRLMMPTLPAPGRAP